jgi:type VI protein secretion system component VasK
MTIGPRLQQYLSTIFVAGEWSPKPLFLRGIYFTSSMRQGAALDTELAQALGLSVESLPEGRQWKQDESFFLKDMFLRKVFPEKGLVTRQSKAQGLDSRRKAVVLTAASLAVVALLALTYFGKQQMEQAILTPAAFWGPMAANYEEHLKNKAIVDKGLAVLRPTCRTGR